MGLFVVLMQAILASFISTLPDGAVLAQLSLLAMSFVSIYLGSIWALQPENGRGAGLSVQDAIWYPVASSVVLCILYLFGWLGYGPAFGKIITALIYIWASTNLLKTSYALLQTLLPGIIAWVANLAVSISIGYLYLTYKNHWMFKDVLAIMISMWMIEASRIRSVKVGIVALLGFLIYDIFWVLCTNVMDFTARTMDIPLLLRIPLDFRQGRAARQFAMLGLGDVITPGEFLAILLRFDMKSKRRTKLYFHTVFTAYVIGLVAAASASTVYNRSQPAMLYIGPCCVLTALCLASVRGELEQLLQYRDA